MTGRHPAAGATNPLNRIIGLRAVGTSRPRACCRLLPLLCIAGGWAATLAHAQFPAGGRSLDSKHHHLGRDPLEQPWPGVPAKPEALRIELRFESKANANEWVLAIQQRDVSERAMLLLNGRPIAALKLNEEPKVFFYPVAAGQLKEGENRLSIQPAKPRDNMMVGPVHLYEQGMRDLLRIRPVTVTVSDAATGQPVPARLTFTDRDGNPVELYGAEQTHTAVRLGTLYTLGTPTRLEMREGEYVIYAMRGMEWSRGEAKLSVTPGTPAVAAITIRREVDTTGFIAADTHLHTLTHSGHGDASVEERVLTLAGEGVELAIATDHNHNTDYRPAQATLSLNHYFTSVTGNEVSTPVGHMNGFPLDPGHSPPPHQLEDWVQLVDGMRARGAKVVTLNHPRGMLLPRFAFNLFRLNRASGEFPNTAVFPFDAMELTNPGGNFDAMYLLRDWFALLNFGRKVTAVSASDSHTVGDPVGWWRSYVPSGTDDPAKIDVDGACQRFLAGETSAALGIFTDVRVDDHYTMGQTYSPSQRAIAVRLRVAAPSWVKARRAIVFLNGLPVMEQAIPEKKIGPTDLWLKFSIPLRGHDAHLVCAVFGDGISHPTLPPNPKHTAFTYAVTNPVFLDCDGNGKYSSPRETARAWLKHAGQSLDEQWTALMSADDVVAVQMASLLRQETPAHLRPELDRRIRQAAAQRPLLAEYAQYW